MSDETKKDEITPDAQPEEVTPAEPVTEEATTEVAESSAEETTDAEVEAVEPTEADEVVEEATGPMYPEVVPGTEVRVHQKIKEVNPKGEEKERIQIFQGMVLARKHGSEAGATITVRKMSDGIGVEKIYPLNMPSIVKIEVKRKFRVKRAKLSFLRLPKFKKRLKEIRDQVVGK